MHRVVSADGDGDAGGEHRADGIRFRSHVQNGEFHVHWLVGHGGVSRARAAICAKKSSMNCRASWPPSKPRHSMRKRPTNS